jgi:hypothetical protein
VHRRLEVVCFGLSFLMGFVKRCVMGLEMKFAMSFAIVVMSFSMSFVMRL